MQRPITLPGWFNMRNAVFILSGLAVLGFAYLLISIKVTQNRQEKNQELSALFTGAQQSSASGNYDKAISLFREMEALSAAMPDWSFSAKNGLSRALVKAGRTEEARSKLSEVEMILKKNPDILKGQDLEGAIDFTRRELEMSQKAKLPLRPIENQSQPTDPQKEGQNSSFNSSTATSLDSDDAKKKAKMMNLIESSNLLLEKKNYLDALQGFTELETLSKEYPEYLFTAKKNLITTLLALQRFEEANAKFSEMEAMIASNAKTREDPGSRFILKEIGQQIIASKLNAIKPEPIEHPEKALISKYIRQPIRSDSHEETRIFEEGVRWKRPKEDEAGSISKLELVFSSCQPVGTVSIPRVSGLNFLSQPERSTTFSMINFQTVSTTTLTYMIRILPQDIMQIPRFVDNKGTNTFQIRQQGLIIIPSFSVETDKGTKEVPSLNLALPSI